MKNIKEYNTKLLIIIAVIYELIMYLLTPYIGEWYKLIILVTLIAFFVTFFFFIKKENRNPFYIIFIIGLLIRTYYIFSTSIYDRQNDVGDLNLSGHLNYMYTIFKTHHLPLTNEWQFYHPPLWHFIGASWIYINNLFHFELYNILEGIQVLSLWFSLFSIIIVDKIIAKIKLKNNYRNLICLLMAVHPTLIILSGSINNDCLLMFLELLTILFLINFYVNSNWKNTIYLALVTGFCVMTKTNGAVMAIPILYVFILKLITIIKKDKANLKQFIYKILTFGLISLPIGLWYQIRNIIMFSSNKIPDGGDFLYIGNYSFVSRFLLPDMNNLIGYFTLNDYNLPVTLLKTSMFGDHSSYKGTVLLPNIMQILNIILIIIALFFIIKYIVKNKKKNIIINILFITWISFMLAIVWFNYAYPYRCSMNFRYIAICIFPSIAIFLYELEKIKSKKIKTVIEILGYLFAIINVIFILFAV